MFHDIGIDWSMLDGMRGSVSLGGGIQKNRLRLTKPEWYIFTIRENGKRVGLNRMLKICEELDMVHVPIEEVDMDLPAKYPTVEALLVRADGEYPNGGSVRRLWRLCYLILAIFPRRVRLILVLAVM